MRSRSLEWRIKQIVPATGWDSVLRQDDGTYVAYPVALWALIEHPETGDTDVVGMDGGDYLEYADEDERFLHYRPRHGCLRLRDTGYDYEVLPGGGVPVEPAP